MFPKLNVKRIVVQHFISLRQFEFVDSEKGKFPFSCWLMFLFIPVIITVALYVPLGSIDKEIIKQLISVNSIFVALLLNLMVLLYSMKHKIIEGEDDSRRSARHRIIKYVFANVSFQVLLSLVSIVLLIFHLYFMHPIVINIFDILIIFFTIQIVLGVVLILSRISKLFEVV